MRELYCERLMRAVERKRSSVCVGLDPVAEKIPRELWPRSERSNEAEAQAQAILAFNLKIMDAVCDAAVAVKPQVAFYERLGVAGFSAYLRTIEAAHEHGLIVIGDVKRGDIGSTATAYAEAHLGVGSHYADAITVNPLFGSDGLEPFVQRAEQVGAGLYLLVRTSNPSAAELQDLVCDGVAFHVRVARLLKRLARPTQLPYDDLGAVVGATSATHLKELRAVLPRTSFLLPGYGAQGASAQDCMSAFDSAGHGALVNSSRGILYAFESAPNIPWLDAVARAAIRMRDELPPRRVGS